MHTTALFLSTAHMQPETVQMIDFYKRECVKQTVVCYTPIDKWFFSNTLLGTSLVAIGLFCFFYASVKLLLPCMPDGRK